MFEATVRKPRKKDARVEFSQVGTRTVSDAGDSQMGTLAFHMSPLKLSPRKNAPRPEPVLEKAAS